MNYRNSNIAKSAAVTIATVFANLIYRQFEFNSVEEQLVLEAIRRSSSKLENASLNEISDHISAMNEASLSGLGNNVKGIYHELSFILAENSDGDEITAEIFAETNHPGADIKFIQNGEVIGEVQLKATDGLGIIEKHFDRYPNIPVYATNEAVSLNENAISSGFNNVDLEADVRDAFESLKNRGALHNAEDVAAGAGLLSAALQARVVLSGKKTMDDAAVQTLQDTTIAVSTSFLVDLMFS